MAPKRGTKRKASDSAVAQGPVEHPSHQHISGQCFVAGSGDYGQLGLGEDVTEKFRPGPLVIEGEKVVHVACGGMHTCVLTESGKVFSWGVNDEGALGRVADRHDGGENRPGPVVIPGGAKVLQMSCGDSHTVALTDAGCILGWGTFRDSTGVMGFTADVKIQKTPMVIYDPETNGGVRMVKVASGTDHVAALAEGGAVYTFGCGQQGQLGRIGERHSERGGPSSGLAALLTPAPVAGLARKRGGRKAVDVACGSYHTFAIGSDGSVFGWGLNNYGQLGLPVKESTICLFAPEAVKALKGSTAIAGGQHHSLAMSAEGKLVGCGRGTYGRLGSKAVNPSSDDARPEPVTVDGLEELGITKVTSFDAGIAVSGLCADNGRVYVWGCNSSYQLAKGDDDDDEATPAIVKETKAFQNNFCTQVAFGGQHVVLLGYQKPKPADA